MLQFAANEQGLQERKDEADKQLAEQEKELAELRNRLANNVPRPPPAPRGSVAVELLAPSGSVAVVPYMQREPGPAP